MLRELRVRGYRSLRDVNLELSPLTVVLGANGAGKTNLYQSLQLLSAKRQHVFVVTHSDKLAGALTGATVRTAQLVGGSTVLS